MIVSKIILKPVVTEKAVADQARGYYHLWVQRTSNKNQIKAAFEQLFKVKPLSVKTILVKGHLKKLRKDNRTIMTQTKKKAIIQVPVKTKLPLFVSGSSKK